jgi:membrane-associated protease RseP (regulator of RpoE activity)
LDAARPAPRAWLPAVLFACTLVTIFTTFLVSFVGVITASGGLQVSAAGVRAALQFTLATVTILGAHEFGHYILARRHGVNASLPYFIPVPLLGFGTLGAVIRVRDRIPTRNALVDIGAAGPLAGFLVALPFLAWGYAHTSWVVAPPLSSGLPGTMSLLALVQHGFPTGDFTVYSDNLLLRGFQRVFLGASLPGREAAPHPFILAGWLGTLVTMLNLVPIGQLDAGHLTHALFGRRARLIGRGALLSLLPLGVFVSAHWLVWFLVVSFFVGVRHPEVSRPEEPLSRGRVWLCAVTGVVGVLCFLPAPIVVG